MSALSILVMSAFSTQISFFSSSIPDKRYKLTHLQLFFGQFLGFAFQHNVCSMSVQRCSLLPRPSCSSLAFPRRLHSQLSYCLYLPHNACQNHFTSAGRRELFNNCGGSWTPCNHLDIYLATVNRASLSIASLAVATVALVTCNIFTVRFSIYALRFSAVCRLSFLQSPVFTSCQGPRIAPTRGRLAHFSNLRERLVMLS